MKQYVQYTKDDFIKELGEKWQEIDLHKTKEVVFCYPLTYKGNKTSFELRIFSTLVNGSVRSCGKDAVRFLVFNTKTNKIFRNRSFHRTKNMFSRLKNYINKTCLNILKDICTGCHSGTMVVRCAKNDKKIVFKGCSDFPHCTHKQKIN